MSSRPLPPRRRRREDLAAKTRRGFTLVEVALAAAIGAVLMIVVLRVFQQMSRSPTIEKLGALQSATMISEILHRDMRYMTVPMIKAPVKTTPGLVGGGGPNGAGPNAGANPGGVAGAIANGAAALVNGINSILGNNPAAPEQAVNLAAVSAPDSPLYPFDWDDRPKAGDNQVFDLTEGPKKELTFFRTRYQPPGGGGLFGGGNQASYTVLRVKYEALPSKRYSDPQLYILQRTEEEVEIETNEGTPDPDTVSVVSTGKPKRYLNFYFRRLIVSFHEAPEGGAVTGATPAAPAAATGAAANSLLGQAEMDKLYFARILIAGASAGSGARKVKKAGEAGGAKKQSLDLLVNLIHLDGVTDRFRRRSLAQNWNHKLPGSLNP